jgi:hypothetical protein
LGIGEFAGHFDNLNVLRTGSPRPLILARTTGLPIGSLCGVLSRSRQALKIPPPKKAGVKVEGSTRKDRQPQSFIENIDCAIYQKLGSHPFVRIHQR